MTSLLTHDLALKVEPEKCSELAFTAEAEAVNAIIRELWAFFWFDLECKVMGQKRHHIIIRRSYCISPQYIFKL